ncbi:MAG: HAMP domain-containing histidine kinase [Bacteroidia bacterium]|nr:HAMP domain-containing histidine kinase [Bacteroidia bacterium]
MLISEAGLIGTYFISRYMNKPLLSKILIVIVSFVSIGMFWFEANGILGAMPFYLLLFITVSHTIWESSYHKIIGLATVSFAILFITLEFIFPEWVKSYPSVFAEKVNTTALLLVIAMASSLAMRYFKHMNESNQEALEKQNQELIEKNKELDHLLYSISHDLRAPVVSLQGLMELQKAAATEEEKKQYLDLQERSVNRLDKFIKDMLEYSRAHRSDVKIEPINLMEILEEITQQMEFYHSDKKVEVFIEYKLTKQVFSDPTKIQLILQNLITNAVHYADFSKEKPYCKVMLKEYNHSDILIQVEDNGVGIDKEHGNRIFEMFYRANNDRKGTGIGLYIVQKSLQTIRGNITFSSRKGEGTTFEMVIPNQINLN